MNHEPECFCDCGDVCYCYECICAQLRTAYQRGRDDAAEAVNNDKTYGCCDCVHDREKFVRIARGDGEQK